MKNWPIAPCYKLFFTPLEIIFDPNTIEQISFAYVSSKYGHALQLRDDGSRYFDHPKTAAWIYIHEFGGRDPRIICDLLLHDVVEDSRLLSTYRINRNFGPDIALDVRALTKLPEGKEFAEEYLARIIAREPWAIIAKLFDRLHNLRTLKVCTPEKQAKQVKETKEIVMPVLINSLRQYDKNCAVWLEMKMNEAIFLLEE
jgi:GTP diphosphokinase / guanosine-3',5'-bis(diphosphate) 3'-diphosphatase